MPALILISPEPLSGKTTVAVGLARKLTSAGRRVTLRRLPGGEHGETDGASFTAITLPSAQDKTAGVDIIEAPAGDPRAPLEANPAARAVVVAPGSLPATPLADYCRPLGDRLLGVIINKTPRKRLDTVRTEAEAAGLNVITLLPEDRLLAAPALRDVAQALSAHVEHLNGGGLQPLDRPVIATISADPGQGYFAGYDASAVIVRSDKPDLQLAALNAGATCLIITGGLPLLSYVLERAEADQIPLLRTGLDTRRTVETIEATYAALPFPGGEDKIGRATELLADVDIGVLR